jgi:hypothetical protein
LASAGTVFIGDPLNAMVMLILLFRCSSQHLKQFRDYDIRLLELDIEFVKPYQVLQEPFVMTGCESLSSLDNRNAILEGELPR